MGQGRVYTTAIIVSVMLVCALVLGARWHALGQRVPLSAGTGDASVALAQPADESPPGRTKTYRRKKTQKRSEIDPSTSKPAQSRTSAAPSLPVDINTATQTQLEQLPGIGPVLAERIVEYRKAHGPFASLDGLLDVSGIGEKKLAALRGVAVCSSGK